MSRIGDQSISIPDNISLEITAGNILVKGPKGEQQLVLPSGISAKLENNALKIKRRTNQRQHKANHGLARSLVNNLIIGVNTGFTKKLELVGTGYHAKKEGQNLVLSVGFSHPVVVEPLAGVTLDLEGETVIVVVGIDKQKVGLMAAMIRDIRKPEPYKGKGIRYQGEIIRRKAGKSAKVGSAA